MRTILSFFPFTLPMIEIDLDKFSKEGAPIYNIKAYLNNYFKKQFITMCSVCKNQTKVEYKMINNSPILIIHFFRNDPTKPNKTEINLDFNINLSEYITKDEKISPFRLLFKRVYQL